MLEWLKLENVGPAPKFELDFAPRVNLITGDNGLGKSFLLDVAWFALTGTWRDPVQPQTTKNVQSAIKFRVHSQESDSASIVQEQFFIAKEQQWFDRTNYGAQGISLESQGLVISVRVDGGFSIYDRVKNAGTLNLIMGRSKAFFFDPNQIWTGMQKDNIYICNGLIQDWANWQRENNDAFKQLKTALLKLSPTPNELFEPGELTYVVADSRAIPTVKMPHGQSVPIIHASAGIRRISALAYALIWTWQEHLRACEMMREPPAKNIVLLIDELEQHLHPSWQRVLLPALLEVVKTLTKKHALTIQIIATTHSPLVMASLEPLFDPKQDAWFDLNLVDGEVTLEKMLWRKHGDANAWLQSEAFDLPSTGSVQAGEVKERAAKALENSRLSKKKFLELDAEVRATLAETDSFLMRWHFWGEKKGWL